MALTYIPEGLLEYFSSTMFPVLLLSLAGVLAAGLALASARRSSARASRRTQSLLPLLHPSDAPLGSPLRVLTINALAFVARSCARNLARPEKATRRTNERWGRRAAWSRRFSICRIT